MSGMIGVNATPLTHKSYANGVRTLIETTFKKGEDFRPGLFALAKTDMWQDRDVEVGGIADFEEWTDNTPTAESEIREGYATVYTQAAYANRVPIGRLFRKFQGEKMNIVRRAAMEVANKGYRHMQEGAFSLYNYGFATTNSFFNKSALLSDGKRLFDDDHPCSPDNATTWSNVLTDNAVVGRQALKDMIINLHDQLDDRGNKLFLGQAGYTWLVPINQYDAALEVVKSVGKPDTADNNVNAYNEQFSGRPIEVRWAPFLTSTTAHFLVAKEAMEYYEPLKVLTSIPFETDTYEDEATMTLNVRAMMAYTVGASSGRGVVGSQGTGTGTYSGS